MEEEPHNYNHIIARYHKTTRATSRDLFKCDREGKFHNSIIHDVRCHNELKSKPFMDSSKEYKPYSSLDG